MSVKLQKLGAERDKARQKRDEWDARYKELDRRYQEQENSEICEEVRSYNLNPDQLAELLLKLKEQGLPNPELMNTEEQPVEVEEHEE